MKYCQAFYSYSIYVYEHCSSLIWYIQPFFISSFHEHSLSNNYMPNPVLISHCFFRIPSSVGINWYIFTVSPGIKQLAPSVHGRQQPSSIKGPLEFFSEQGGICYGTFSGCSLRFPGPTFPYRRLPTPLSIYYS